MSLSAPTRGAASGTRKAAASSSAITSNRGSRTPSCGPSHAGRSRRRCRSSSAYPTHGTAVSAKNSGVPSGACDTASAIRAASVATPPRIMMWRTARIFPRTALAIVWTGDVATHAELHWSWRDAGTGGDRAGPKCGGADHTSAARTSYDAGRAARRAADVERSAQGTGPGGRSAFHRALGGRVRGHQTGIRRRRRARVQYHVWRRGFPAAESGGVDPEILAAAGALRFAALLERSCHREQPPALVRRAEGEAVCPRARLARSPDRLRRAEDRIEQPDSREAAARGSRRRRFRFRTLPHQRRPAERPLRSGTGSESDAT